MSEIFGGWARWGRRKNLEISDPKPWPDSHSVRVTVLEKVLESESDYEFVVATHFKRFRFFSGRRKYGDSRSKIMVGFALGASGCAGKVINLE